MMAWTEEHEYLQVLEEMLAAHRLPDEIERQGRKILARATAPVSILITGPQDSGKTRLANLLIGRPVIGGEASGVAIEWFWSAKEKTEILDAAGTRKTTDGLDLSLPEIATAARVRLGLPDLSLKSFNLKTFATDRASPDDFLAAVETADLVLWCGQDFLPEDQALWAQVPDMKKDHSYFVLTKADLFSEPGQLQERLDNLNDLVGEEFYSLVPVATLQALTSLPKGDEPDDAAFVASGGKALVTTIARHVETGRKADLDTALLFLSRHGATMDARPDAPAPRRPAPSEVHAAQTAPQPAPDTLPTALELMRDRSRELIEIAKDNENKAASILSHCVATSEELITILGDIDEKAPEAEQVYETALDAADLLILMQMEDGIGPAADAVTLMLQLRRDIENAVAA